LKVIQILPELHAGGVERGTLEVGRFLVANGHQSVVISHGGSLVESLERDGSRHLKLPVHRKSPVSLLQVRPLRRLLEAERPDILHLRSRLPAWIAYLAWKGMDPARRPALVTTVHGFYSVSRYSAVMTRGERVICVSNSIRDYVLKHYPEVPAERLRVIHRGIEPADYRFGDPPPSDWLEKWNQDFPETCGKCLLTLPGRITRLKGHEDFFKLLAALPPGHHGLVVGNTHPRKTGYLEELRAMIERMGLGERVTFTGHRRDLREIFQHSQIVFSLSQKPESFGRTTLEALSLGTPVIGYEHGGVGEILDPLFPAGKVGLGDIGQMRRKVGEILEGGLRPAREHPFTLHHMLHQTLATYQDLVSAHPSRDPA
jgi:glycosyltransferase involved in cell wall biosynthesis